MDMLTRLRQVDNSWDDLPLLYLTANCYLVELFQREKHAALWYSGGLRSGCLLHFCQAWRHRILVLHRVDGDNYHAVARVLDDLGFLRSQFVEQFPGFGPFAPLLVAAANAGMHAVLLGHRAYLEDPPELTYYDPLALWPGDALAEHARRYQLEDIPRYAQKKQTHELRVGSRRVYGRLDAGPGAAQPAESAG